MILISFKYFNRIDITTQFQASDVMFRLEDYSAGNKIVEQVIAYMQFVAHPSFNVTDVSITYYY